MPSFSSKVQLASSAKDSNIVLADVERIKGAFKVFATTDAMTSQSVNYYSDGQLVYAEDSASLYKATVTPADYINTFSDTVSFSAFSFNSGSFVSASFDGTNTLTFFGESVDGSPRISMSVDLSALTGSDGGGGGGSGDITAVIAGSGLSGGANTGAATLTVDSGSLAGLGIDAPAGGQFNIDTGSSHFEGGVQQVSLDGGEI